jgi:putative ATP-dependent endonuclease of OLD family
MTIRKIRIENFKLFEGIFELELNSGINIIVGNNEAGKSTIIEAIHLALTGLYNGKYLKNELNQYVFNAKVVNDYIQSLQTPSPQQPPRILIEIYLNGDDSPNRMGNGNTHKDNSACGFACKIEFNEAYKEEYEELLKVGSIKTLPIEYYDISWYGFDWNPITTKMIPLKSALIDSSNSRFQNGSDVYISRIVKDLLDTSDVVNLSQAHRKMKEAFIGDASIVSINEKISDIAQISNKKVKLSVELSSKNAWESSLITCVEEIPFQNIGKGEQCIIKTKLALGHKKAKEANIVLIEEPENHLSHSKLNELLKGIESTNGEKQILVSTHNSFVANKLGLGNLILLHDRKTLRLSDLEPATFKYFQKLAGYDTLRFILCDKAILVEGDSDELVVQKAFINKYGCLPIERGVDIISVGTSFLRFLEIANKLHKQVAVVTDNDGNSTALENKYKDYVEGEDKPYIKICYDHVVANGDMSDFNYNTLEPCMLRANSLQILNDILKKECVSEDELLKYMHDNKTECALKVFEYEGEIKFPQYISDAINYE